jgi:YegS/Rv2252/BmrU family lipid kinase
LVYNPIAGPRDVSVELQEVVAFLEQQGWEVTLRRTLGSGDATTFAREAAARGVNMVVAVGGDGTLGEVANGLAGSECVLGVLPVGTGNVWAHMFGLPVWSHGAPTALMDAARVLVEGQLHRIDLGKAGHRYFVLWSGIGLDAEVAQQVEPHREMRRSLGNLTYFVAAVVVGLGMRGSRMTVVLDGKATRQRIVLILITNAQLYGSSWPVAPQAQLDDGLLDGYIFKGGNILDVLRHLVTLLLGQQQHDPKIIPFRAKRVEIRGERSLPLHLDGDPAGRTPVTITVVPHALRVIVPREASDSLFQEPGAPAAAEFSLATRIAGRLRWERERHRQRLADGVDTPAGSTHNDRR